MPLASNGLVSQPNNLPAWLKGDTQREPYRTLSNQIVSVGRPPDLTDVDRLRNILGAWASIYNVSYKLAPYNPDTLTTQKGFDVMGFGANGQEGMLQLAACRGPYNLKRQSVLYKGYKVELHPRGKDASSSDHSQAEELALFIAEMLDNITLPDTHYTQPFQKVMYDMLSAIWFGFAVSEIEWRVADRGRYKGKWMLAEIANKPCKQIGFDLDDTSLSLRAFKPYTPLHGYGPPVPVEKALIYTFDMDQNLPYGNGLSRSCYKHWWKINSVLKFWVGSLERFGGGGLVVQYPAGNDAAASDALTTLDNVRNSVSIVLPDNIKYDFVQAASGMFQGFKDSCDWDKQEILQQVLGSTLSTGEGQHGTQALGSVHQDTRQIGDDFVAGELESVFNTQLIPRAISYNFGEKALDLCPRLNIIRQNNEDLFNIANAMNLLVTMGNMSPLSKIIRERMDLAAIDPEEEKWLVEQRKMQDEIKQQIAAAEASRKNPQAGSQAEANQKEGVKKADAVKKFAQSYEDLLTYMA